MSSRSFNRPFYTTAAAGSHIRSQTEFRTGNGFFLNDTNPVVADYTTHTAATEASREQNPVPLGGNKEQKQIKKYRTYVYIREEKKAKKK